MTLVFRKLWAWCKDFSTGWITRGRILIFFTLGRENRFTDKFLFILIHDFYPHPYNFLLIFLHAKVSRWEEIVIRKGAYTSSPVRQIHILPITRRGRNLYPFFLHKTNKPLLITVFKSNRISSICIVRALIVRFNLSLKLTQSSIFTTKIRYYYKYSRKKKSKVNFKPAFLEPINWFLIDEF